ncbi:hypothetical protein ACWKSP_29010 [Micromonosporaceae bacterium Da 78-11]
MLSAKAKGRAPKSSAARQVHLLKSHAAGEHGVAQLGALPATHRSLG